MTSTRRQGIGEGLDALFSVNDTTDNSNTGVISLSIDRVFANPNQPRKIFFPEKIAELALSIKENGIIQPIIVRQVEGSTDQYEIVAGERRWRAAQEVGLLEIPVIIKNIDDQTLAAFTLIENIQRENLNVVEEARGYKKLLDEFELTHDEVAERVGKPRTTISNFLRLLRLDPAVLQMLSEKKIDIGHAKVLLALDNNDQVRVGEEIVQRQLTVRQTEKRVREQQYRGTKSEQIIDFDLLKRANDLKNNFSELTGKPIDVKLKNNGNEKGYLKLEFHSLNELAKLFEYLQRGKKHSEDNNESE